jgi:hypothetical protein
LPRLGDTERVIALRYRDRDFQPQELVSEAFAFDSALSLYALEADGERRFVGELEQNRLNVYGEEWTGLEFHGLKGEPEVRYLSKRKSALSSVLSIGQAWGAPRLYDLKGGGQALAELGAAEILICLPSFLRTLKPRRMSALAA